jgi:hypothetical protein
VKYFVVVESINMIVVATQSGVSEAHPLQLPQRSHW